MSQLTLQQALDLAHSSYNSGNFAQAESLVRQILAQLPQQPDALHLLGILAVQCNRHDTAVELFQQAIAIHPKNPLYYNSLGNIFEITRQYDRAVEIYRHGLQLEPNFPQAHGNLGVALHNRGSFAEALQSYARAIALDPNYADARLHNSFTLLLTGQFAPGWEEHEWRWKSSNFPTAQRHFSQPLWTGQDLTDKILLLHSEQAFGDAIQFIRYVALVAELHPKHILVECLPELLTLFQSIPDIALFPIGSDLPPFDYQIPILTLPRTFQITLETIPHIVPYLAAPPERVAHFRSLLDQHFSDSGTRPRIGLAWHGKPRPYAYRSMPIALLSPLAQFQNVSFISLQTDPAAADLAAAPFPMLDLSSHLKDFADTAALISNLDLLITIDTATAHLSGALAKPTWTLLPHVADWRWLLNRSDSPWYPTMKLFRQPSQDNWPAVMEQVATELDNLKLEGKNES